MNQQTKPETAQLITVEEKPLITTKYFMAHWIDGDRDTDGGWNIFRLLDFCNPALTEGPQSLYCLSDEQNTRGLMLALDAVYDAALAREVKVATV